MKTINYILIILLAISCKRLTSETSTKSKNYTPLLDSITENTIEEKIEEEAKQEIDYESIEIINSPFTNKFELQLKSIEKDWWEDLFLIVKEKDSLNVYVPVTSQSILYASFISIENLNSTFFEVFDITHMGNGYYNLFEYTKDTLVNLINVRAVDRHQEGGGINEDSSYIIKNDRLISEYIDLNGDKLVDIKLSGTGYLVRSGNVISDKEKLHLKNPIKLERQFYWNNQTNKFEEQLDKKKGVWFDD